MKRPNYRYTGFYGQLIPNSPHLITVCWRLGAPGIPFAGKNGVVQWFLPSMNEVVDPLPKTPEGQLLLAGLVWHTTASPTVLTEDVIHAVLNKRYDLLATISENSAGCFVGQDKTLYLWVGFASEDYVFFRQNGQQISWSTNPLDLDSDIDQWALRRCCHAEDIFIYTQIERVEQGNLLQILPDGTRFAYQFDRFAPDPELQARPMGLKHFLSPTRKALRNAVRPLVCGEPIGLMLSGGVGSAALLAVMKEEGVDVVAYHLDAAEPAASELRFAQMTCEALEVPLKVIMMDTSCHYLSPEWVFSHPDGHPWPRWFAQIAQQARQDNIRLLVTGAGDDHAFGPADYGISLVLAARIPWQEKRKIVQGLLSTDWNLFDIFKSLCPSFMLHGPRAPTKVNREMRKADFLTPLPLPPRGLDDAAVLHSPCFAPQSLAVEQTILQPEGVRLYYPYHQREVQAVSLALPAAYRLIPRNLLPPSLTSARADLDFVMNKPVLRLAFSDILPPEVAWRTWTAWTKASIQAFCLDHVMLLREVLGEDSCLAIMGIVDTARLEEVLASPTRLRENYLTLVASCMVELFLKNAWQEQRHRGGPLWK